MVELDSEQHATLRHVHQTLKEESLTHRRTIHSVFTLSMAGLMVVLGGIVSVGHMETRLKWFLGFAVFFLVVIILYLIRQQRSKSEEDMEIVRRIEKRLELDAEGVYIRDEPVLPREFAKPRDVAWGFSEGDLLQILALVGLAVIIVTVVAWQ